MGSHVLRPLFAIIVLLAAILIARAFIVPKDFGVGERGYMYGWHRAGNEAEWRAVEPKYRTAAYCKDCHSANYTSIKASRHAPVACENCHGPARGHPTDPPKLAIDRSRTLCLRCHARLAYPGSGRARMPSVDPATHNPGAACAGCHNPHHPDLGAAR